MNTKEQIQTKFWEGEIFSKLLDLIVPISSQIQIFLHQFASFPPSGSALDKHTTVPKKICKIPSLLIRISFDFILTRDDALGHQLVDGPPHHQLHLQS